MNISILIPWRTDNGQRERLWDHCRQVWEQSSYEIVTGTDQGYGPFNIAKAFNQAARKATGEYFILYGADHLPDFDRVEWATEQLTTQKWCALYAETAGLSQTDTNAILAGFNADNITPTQVAPFCTAIIGIRRDAWIDFDQRFTGWGGEDTAWRMVLETLYGPTPQPSGRLRCLYHEAAPRSHTDHNFALIGEYMTAQAEGRMLQYVTELGLTGGLD